MSRDKQSGFAIKPDGELISVFSIAKGRGMLLGAATVKAGAKHLDCLDANHLAQLYSHFGFEETKRMAWDDQYAPPNWNYERFDNPDVVFMERK